MAKSSFTRRNLPHWTPARATYFITWRLHRAQSCLSDVERDLVVNIFKHDDGSRYHLHAWVVMDDHVHLLVTPISDNSLSSLLHSWKSFSANRLQRLHNRRGRVWQDESYDRFVRELDEAQRYARYIVQNPVKRWPHATTPYLWVGSVL